MPLFDFRLYLPRSWCADRARRERARVPEEAEFTTKPALGAAMIAGAAGAGVPFAWVAGDEVYGRGSKLREACEKERKGNVFAVPVNFTVTLPSGRKTTIHCGRADPADGVGDPLVRARLQGPSRLRMGLGRDLLPAAPGHDPPQPVRP